MNGMQVTTETTRGGNELSELEIPMVNTMMTCLGREHRRLDEHILPLALAATRLASDPGALTAEVAALEIWDEIRAYLYSLCRLKMRWCFPGARAIRQFQILCFKRFRPSVKSCARWLLVCLRRRATSVNRKRPPIAVVSRSVCSLWRAHSIVTSRAMMVTFCPRWAVHYFSDKKSNWRHQVELAPSRGAMSRPKSHLNRHVMATEKMG